MDTPRPVNRLRTSSPTSTVVRRSRRQGRLKEHSVVNRMLQLLVRAVLFLFFLSIGWVIILKYLPVSITPLMLFRKLEAFNKEQSSQLYKDWTPYEAISPEAALAVIASEDQDFPHHWGFDFDEIQNAIRKNRYRKRARGASTISQQVAKNVFLWNGRSYIRKGLEVYFTFLIELIWGKERILEVYLNVAETGEMTFGIEAASHRFYGHSAKTLTRSEAARLAAVLPNPRLFSVKKPSVYIQRRTRQITQQMKRLGGQSYLKHL